MGIEYKKSVKKEPASIPARFKDDFFRAFDTPTDGYRDASGFVSRLPLRLESNEVIVYGLVDAEKMWEQYGDERYKPILVGGKAVVTVWFNNFLDTDCGGSYVETWYNTFVTAKDKETVTLPMSDNPFSVLKPAGLPSAQSFLLRVLCGDNDDNPGAAMKAILGGRAVFGFPKHPVPAQISFKYTMKGEKKVGVAFECEHLGKKAVSLKCELPEADEKGCLKVPVSVAKTAPNACIGGPLCGGTHKGHNGAIQTVYATSLKCTQNVALWNKDTDYLALGDNEHYAPLSKWDFQPTVKVHSPDFKIVAHKPSGWISGEDAAKEVARHEELIATGTKAGAL